MSGYRYKWFAGSILWTDINENEDEYYISMSKALVAHDPVDSNGDWFVLRVGKNVFMIMHEDECAKYKEDIDEKKKQGADFFPAYLKENDKAYAFCWKRDFMKEPVDDMRSWSFNRLDRNFFMLYPHVIKDDNTREVLKQLEVFSTE